MIKIAYSDKYVIDLPEGHKFPMIKYELIKEQLLYEGTITSENLYDPGLVAEEIILTTHTSAYWNALKSQQVDERIIRKIGFPMSEKLVNRSRSSVNGTVNAALHALKHGIAFNIAGGTHHAYADKGEGFCLLNDIAVASNYLIREKLAKKILIIDLDVHQGNGSAKIFESNETVFTFSMHCQDNYPLKKEQSDLDISLPAFTCDNTYLAALYDALPSLLSKVNPDFIFFQAGVDVLETDKLGKLSLTKDGCKKRDEYVLTSCKSASIPLAISMGGGYSAQIRDIVDAHCNTYRLAFDIYH